MGENQQVSPLVWVGDTVQGCIPYGWRASDPLDGSEWYLSSCGDGQGGRVVPLYRGAMMVGVFADSKAARARAEELRKGAA